MSDTDKAAEEQIEHHTGGHSPLSSLSGKQKLIGAGLLVVVFMGILASKKTNKAMDQSWAASGASSSKPETVYVPVWYGGGQNATGQTTNGGNNTAPVVIQPTTPPGPVFTPPAPPFTPVSVPAPIMTVNQPAPPPAPGSNVTIVKAPTPGQSQDHAFIPAPPVQPLWSETLAGREAIMKAAGPNGSINGAPAIVPLPANGIPWSETMEGKAAMYKAAGPSGSINGVPISNIPSPTSYGTGNSSTPWSETPEGRRAILAAAGPSGSVNGVSISNIPSPSPSSHGSGSSSVPWSETPEGRRAIAAAAGANGSINGVHV